MLISHPSINNKNKRRTMKTKNIFKALALAIMMPAMLLTTACSNEDDFVNNSANTENTINKGYALPVTVNVTRGDGATTRATYDDNDKKLSFSAGDKLFVSGTAGGYDYEFAGTLDYVSEGTFSGTIYTSKEWTGTADALFTAAIENNGYIIATLLPAGYEDYGFLTIENNDTEEKYDDSVEFNFTYTLATSKAAGVEQFSYEKATTYSSGFALAPQNAILNFTITGLAASTNVAVSLTGSGYTITKTVTTDGSGNATFAAGVEANTDLNELSLTVGGKAVTLTSTNKQLAAGRIYNITRSAVLCNVTAGDLGKVIGADGKIYNNKAAAEAVATGNALAMIAYVGALSDCTHGLAISLSDIEAYQMNYTLATGEYAIPVWAAAHPIAGATWRLPSQKDWQYMLWGYHVDAPVATNISTSDISTVLVNNGYYWTSTEVDTDNAKTVFYDGTYAGIQNVAKTWNSHVRACLVF